MRACSLACSTACSQACSHSLGIFFPFLLCNFATRLGALQRLRLVVRCFAAFALKSLIHPLAIGVLHKLHADGWPDIRKLIGVDAQQPCKARRITWERPHIPSK